MVQMKLAAQEQLHYIAAPQKVVAIVNPHSGFGYGQRVLHWLRRRKWGAEVTAFETQPNSLDGHHQALDYARQNGADRLLIYGGDGTLMETLTVMLGAGKAIPISLIPGGTGNIIASDLDMPRRILPALRQAFRAGLMRWWDIGRLENTGQYFALRASVGHDAATLATTDPIAKRRIGAMAYALPAVRELLKSHPIKFTLRIDGGAPIEHLGITAFVAASSRLSSHFDFVLSRHIHPEDGILHVGVMRPQHLFRNLPSMLEQAALEAIDIVSLYPVYKSVTIEAETPQLAQVDGELLDITTPISITNIPQTAPLVSPLPRGLKLRDNFSA